MMHRFLWYPLLAAVVLFVLLIAFSAVATSTDGRIEAPERPSSGTQAVYGKAEQRKG